MKQIPLKTNNLNVNHEIFQGDSLSPLLFWRVLILLSIELTYTACKYKSTTKKINHLFYMDDSRLKAKKKKNDASLVDLQSTVKKIYSSHRDAI